jgi:hypothetical protein
MIYIVERFEFPKAFDYALNKLNKSSFESLPDKRLRGYYSAHNKFKNQDSEIFWFLYTKENRSGLPLIVSTLMFYFIGFFYISIVFIESIMTVKELL